MKINYKEISLNIYTGQRNYSSEKISIIFLHGFTGRGTDWSPVIDRLDQIFYPVAPDIIGHGESDSPDDIKYYSEFSLIEQLDFIITQLSLKKVILCGYSMGGRIALSYTLRYPDKVLGLILESTTPGISRKKERIERIKNDELLSEKIMNDGVESFITYWMKIPLFSSLQNNPNVSAEKIIEERNNNSATGLSNSLKGFSTGRMSDYWKEIPGIKQNTLLITGELDRKYSETNSSMKEKIELCRHEIIKGCGHNTHLENPEEFFILVSSFMRTFIS